MSSPSVQKLTKTKDAFPNENSLLKLLYLGLMNVTVRAVTEFDNKATHGYPPVLKWHRPFL
ncbi:hypothetical protein FI955_23890 [Salmonella enterica]|nr:hypothetical protein [Salmonella enterica]EFF9276564.1 hypothetical protein [Escherichia coli]EFG1667223.1 hypothetical protein [Escherichia coli]